MAKSDATSGIFKCDPDILAQTIESLNAIFPTINAMIDKVNAGASTIAGARGIEKVSSVSKISSIPTNAETLWGDIEMLKGEIVTTIEKAYEYSNTKDEATGFWATGIGSGVATAGVFLGSVLKGVGQVVEGIVDCGAMIAGKAYSIFANDEDTAKFQDKISGFVATSWVDKAYDKFYTQTEFGRSLNASSKMAYNGTLANCTAGVAKWVGIAALSIIPGGGPLIAAAVAGTSGMGQKSQQVLNEGKDFDTAFSAGVKQGAIDAVSAYALGRGIQVLKCARGLNAIGPLATSGGASTGASVAALPAAGGTAGATPIAGLLPAAGGTTGAAPIAGLLPAAGSGGAAIVSGAAATAATGATAAIGGATAATGATAAAGGATIAAGAAGTALAPVAAAGTALAPVAAAGTALAPVAGTAAVTAGTAGIGGILGKIGEAATTFAMNNPKIASAIPGAFILGKGIWEGVENTNMYENQKANAKAAVDSIIATDTPKITEFVMPDIPKASESEPDTPEVPSSDSSSLGNSSSGGSSSSSSSSHGSSWGGSSSNTSNPEPTVDPTPSTPDPEPTVDPTPSTPDPEPTVVEKIVYKYRNNKKEEETPASEEPLADAIELTEPIIPAPENMENVYTEAEKEALNPTVSTEPTEVITSTTTTSKKGSNGLAVGLGIAAAGAAAIAGTQVYKKVKGNSDLEENENEYEEEEEE